VDGILSVYSTDIVMMPPDEKAIHGKDALRRWFASLFSDAAFQPAAGTSDDLELAGDLAVERMTLRNGARQATGKVIHVYRRQSDGRWKITRDIWNADAPTPRPR
jgi:ketosteroid isomerase-like protein